MNKIAFTFAIAITVAACGRTGTGGELSFGTTTVTNQVVQPEAPSVVGTFEQPAAGVKVTSANTVLPPQAQVAPTPPANSVATTAPAATNQARTAQTYVVQQGDTLSVIANNKFDLKVSDVLAANPEIGDRHEIKHGQVLNIPGQ